MELKFIIVPIILVIISCPDLEGAKLQDYFTGFQELNDWLEEKSDNPQDLVGNLSILKQRSVWPWQTGLKLATGALINIGEAQQCNDKLYRAISAFSIQEKTDTRRLIDRLRNNYINRLWLQSGAQCGQYFLAKFAKVNQTPDTGSIFDRKIRLPSGLETEAVNRFLASMGDKLVNESDNLLTDEGMVAHVVALAGGNPPKSYNEFSTILFGTLHTACDYNFETDLGTYFDVLRIIKRSLAQQFEFEQFIGQMESKFKHRLYQWLVCRKSGTWFDEGFHKVYESVSNLL